MLWAGASSMTQFPAPSHPLPMPSPRVLLPELLQPGPPDTPESAKRVPGAAGFGVPAGMG